METKLNELSKKIVDANKAKGFYEDYDMVMELIAEHGTQEHIDIFERAITGQRLALIVSEASEALESDRKNKVFWTTETIQQINNYKYYLDALNDVDFVDSFNCTVKDTKEDEIADILIRVLDFCGANDIDIDFHVKQKLRYNALRPNKHGKIY